MSDHWKSLANQLGAPGADLPEESTSISEEDKSDRTAQSQGDEQPQSVPVDEVVEANAADEPEVEVVEAFEEPRSSATGDEKTESADEVESVGFLEVDKDGSSPPEEDEKESEPEVISALPTKAKPAKERKSAPSPKKTKRKSSWESLANLFNIHLDQPDEEDPMPQAEATDASAEIQDLKGDDEDADAELSWKSADDDSPKEGEEPLKVFDGSEDDQNPALKALFGDPPRKQHDGWYKKRRVVDDVGGWDDELDDEGQSEEEPPATRPSSKRDDDLSFGTEDSEGEEVERRSRRRRRRGRGRDRDNIRDRGEDSDKEIDSDAAWEDSQSSPAGRSRPVEGDEDDRPGATEEHGEAERRSNRRRRGGRRGRPSEPAETETRRERDSAGGDESLDFDEADSDDFPEKPTGRRRRDADRSGRGKARVSDSGRERDLSSEDGDDDEDRVVKHRNIPTWEDAIRSLVEVNSENHRRNDSRGGGRGRSRGRR